MSQNNYASMNSLRAFLNNLKNTFSPLTHTHNLSDIKDYKIDDSLSASSANPVQNKVVDAEFEAVATAMNALESAVDSKAGKEELDNYYTIEATDERIDSAVDQKSLVQIVVWEDGD